MGKFCLFIVLVLFYSYCPFAVAQEMPVKEVPAIVIETNKKFFLDDHHTSLITLKQGIPGQYQNVGDILKKNSSVVIRNYGGAGSLISISMHGTGSNHTQLTWNGIPLNSPTTGQADLSMVPASFIQSIEVINGASGSLFGSGTFGGAINLDNEPDWNNIISGQYSITTGSFGTIGHLVTFKAGNKRLQYQLSAIRNHSENNFTYKDYYQRNSPEVRNLHNEYNGFGVIQNLSVNLDKGGYLEAGIWYQKKSLEIPALMGSYRRSQALQNDSMFRTFLSYQKKGSRYALMFRSAWLSDFLNYRDKTYTDSAWAMDSHISARRLLNQADFRYYVTSNLVGGAGMEYNYLSGSSNNYDGKIRENDFAVFANLKYILKDVILNAGLRKEFYNNLNPDPQYAIGLRYMINRHLAVRSSFSTKFRKPSFNEKYWRPGGNPHLNPEKGKGGELTIEWIPASEIQQTKWLNASIGLYYQTVDNWIQWVMLDSLTPVEYKKVHAKGIDTKVGFGFNMGLVKQINSLNYSYNLSTIAGTTDGNRAFEGNQLIYIPRHTLMAKSAIEYKGLLFDVCITHSGRRETTETADPAYRLPAYTIVDLSAGFSKKISNVPIGLYLGIDNLFDTSFEVIRSYPMPGRSFHFSFAIGFNKSCS